MDENHPAILKDIYATILSIQGEQRNISASVDAISGRVDALSGIVNVLSEMRQASKSHGSISSGTQPLLENATDKTQITPAESEPISPQIEDLSLDSKVRRPSLTSRIILTTYPGQSGIDPLPMSWGHRDPAIRGPVTVSRNASTVRRRNGQSMSEDASEVLTS
jgi:hypothetical protein